MTRISLPSGSNRLQGREPIPSDKEKDAYLCMEPARMIDYQRERRYDSRAAR